MAKKSQQHEALLQHYQKCQEQRRWESTQREAYVGMVQSSVFMHETHEVEDITDYLQDLYQAEIRFKEQVKGLLENPTNEIPTEIRAHFVEYLSYNWNYFNGYDYEPKAIQALFGSINYFNHIVPHLHFKRKKEMLDFQASLA